MNHTASKSAPTKTASAEASKSGVRSLKEAQYSFAVEDLKQSGKNVSFTIPSDARAHDKKGDAVRLSGMYTGAKNTSRMCPLVDSRDVSKDVKNYNAMSGRAEVIATFKDPKIASSAVKSGCILIDDAG